MCWNIFCSQIPAALVPRTLPPSSPPSPTTTAAHARGVTLAGGGAASQVRGAPQLPRRRWPEPVRRGRSRRGGRGWASRGRAGDAGEECGAGVGRESERRGGRARRGAGAEGRERRGRAPTRGQPCFARVAGGRAPQSEPQTRGAGDSAGRRAATAPSGTDDVRAPGFRGLSGGGRGGRT